MTQAEVRATPKGAVAARKPRPLLMPKMFFGKSNTNDRFDHFKNVVKINEWDEAAKYMWLCVRLMGRAQTALRR